MIGNEIPPFLTKHFRASGGAAKWFGGSWNLEVEFDPFDIPVALSLEESALYQGVQTSLRLEGIDRLPKRLEAAAGNALARITRWRTSLTREFCFPVNPQPGYIDGSMYLVHAHHPVDITRMAFKAGAGRTLEVLLSGQLVLEHEGLPFSASGFYRNAPLHLHIRLLPAGDGQWRVHPD